MTDEGNDLTSQWEGLTNVEELSWRQHPASWEKTGTAHHSQLGAELWQIITKLRNEQGVAEPRTVSFIGVGRNLGAEILDALKYLQIQEERIFENTQILKGIVAENLFVAVGGGAHPGVHHSIHGENLTPIQQDTYRRLRTDGTAPIAAERLARALHP